MKLMNFSLRVLWVHRLQHKAHHMFQAHTVLRALPEQAEAEREQCFSEHLRARDS